ncbi:MAG: hypothetical protein BRC55_06680, partial [Cyanobacteria bacterium SW_8_48_13]
SQSLVIEPGSVDLVRTNRKEKFHYYQSTFIHSPSTAKRVHKGRNIDPHYMQLPLPKTHHTKLSLDCKLSLARCYSWVAGSRLDVTG